MGNFRLETMERLQGRVSMNVDTKARLKWSRDILLTAREKLVLEKNRADRGRSVDIIQIITMVDAAALIAKEVLESE